MENSLTYKKITLLLAATLIFIASCKENESNNKTTVIEKEIDPENKRLPESNDLIENSLTENREVKEDDIKKLKIMQRSDQINSLTDSGVRLPEPSVPDVAKQVLLDIKTKLNKVTDDRELKPILNELLKTYWIEELKSKVTVDEVNFNDKFRDSKKVIDGITSGKSEQDLSLEKAQARYAIFTIMSLLSEYSTNEVGVFFDNRMKSPDMNEGDLLVAQIAFKVRPFTADNRAANLSLLKKMGHSKNPVYRALAIVTANTYYKDNSQLFQFYDTFMDDPIPEIVILILDELSKFESQDAINKIKTIKHKFEGKSNLIYNHAEKLLTP